LPLAKRPISRYTEQVFDPGDQLFHLRRTRVRRLSVPIYPMFHMSRFAIPIALGAALIVSALASSRTDANIASQRAHPAARTQIYRTTRVSDFPSTRSEWERYDTAAYVVSTLNLLTNRTARSFSTRLRTRYGISAYVVRSDLSISGLYYVQLIRSQHHVAAAFVYRMGWTKPQALNALGVRLGGKMASRSVRRSYRNDATRPLGSFTSTLPSYH